MKKIISIALALLMVAVMLPVMAMAADTLPDPENGIITLTKSYMVKDETVVLDLKGNTITGNSIFVYDGGSLTIKNGTVNTTINVYGGKDKTTRLSIESDVVITTPFGIRLEGGANGLGQEFAKDLNDYKTDKGNGTYGKSVIDFAGTINCTDAGIWLYGNIGHSDAVKDMIDPSHNVVNIKNGAKINVTGSGSDGIGLMGCVTVNVEEGASISAGEAAVFVKAGTLNVSGGTLTATDNGPADSILSNGNGAEAGVAAAVAVTGTYNKFHPITVNINGGTFTNVNGNAVFVGHSVSGNAAVPYTKGVDVNITGGNFVSAPGKQAVLIQESVDGDAPSYADNRANAVTGGTFSSDVTEYTTRALVVKDENNYYVGGAAQNAVENANSGEFTVLNAGGSANFNDVKPGVIVKNSVDSIGNITVNGNEVEPGATYTVPGAPIIIYTPDNEPAILSGANQVVAPGSAATFRIDEEYDRLLAVAVDGVTLDKSNYEAWSGSTYIKLLPKFMKTLSVGTHTLTAYFTSHTVSTTFTISEGAKNPATGANDFVGVAAAMAVVSLLGAAAVIRKK